MRDVRNAAGKLVCRICGWDRTVEIIIKQYKTVITFNADKTISVSNYIIE